jgi:hypothetical protein
MTSGEGAAVARPSDPLLRWLRGLLAERKLSAPALAEKSSLERNRVRQILSGHEAMTVDELLQISKALSLSPTDFGLAGVPNPAIEDPASPVALATEPVEDDEIPEPPSPTVAVDPLGNHPRALFEMGFALQCDFLFLLDVAQLDGSGVPQSVLQRYKDRELPIKLDAAYHSYNAPRYEDTAVTLTLSFDALYECRFPWTAVKQVAFYPSPPPPPKEEPAPPPEAPKKGRPFLRLVE